MNYNPPEVQAQYPSIEVHTYRWRNPFREGGKNMQHDQIEIRVATMYQGVEYSEEYIITTVVPGGRDEKSVVDMLTERIEINIGNYKNKRNGKVRN